MKQIAQGAEAKIYADEDVILKERFEKKYRHPELDRKLRKSRTRREAKVLNKLTEIGVSAPGLIEMDDKEMKIKMQRIPGKTIKELVDELERKKEKEEIRRIFKEIGIKTGKMHNAGLIHQDLTTSNMIMHNEKGKVYLIDFGLSFFSEKIEDKAVDLHLLKHAIESRHYRIVEECFNAVKEGYKKSCLDAEAVFKRLEVVEERGRNKGKH